MGKVRKTTYFFSKMTLLFALAVKIKYEIKNAPLCNHIIVWKIMPKESIPDLFFALE